jgi:hypothetical protein
MYRVAELPRVASRKSGLLDYAVLRPATEVAAPSVRTDLAVHNLAVVRRQEVLTSTAMLPAVGMVLIHRNPLRLLAARRAVTA